MRHSAFSLVELLMVIGIIAALMAMLIPALQSSKHQAKAALCGSNIKQLLVALLMYETDNGTLPHAFDDTRRSDPPGGCPGRNQYDRMGWWWFNYTDGFFNNIDRKRTVLCCPSKNLTNLKFKDNILCGNYGVNLSVCKSTTGRQSRTEFIGKPLSTIQISRPSQTLLIVDSGYSMINWWHATETPPAAFGSTIQDTAYIPGLKINEKKDLWPGQENDALNGRHLNKTVNIGFADSHVSRTKADELLVQQSGDTYKNRSPIWVPK